MDNYKDNKSSQLKYKDKSDRATVENAIDPRTRMILFKFLSKQTIDSINGCISTGKEANVYHATCPDGSERAIKIFKTSILKFKDRSKYITGEFRFRHGFCKSNPRKMVATWAEKEMRNLCRVFQAKINCPQPYVLKKHIIIMDFIGKNGLPAPLLKDADIDQATAGTLYMECVLMMASMFKKCKLIHGDLSEYNLLLHKKKLVMIDVSQSVEWDHPMAFEFLRKDCVNVNDFFRRKGVSTLTSRELFEFIISPDINELNQEEQLARLEKIAANRSIEDLTEQEKTDEEVFKESYIPQRLDQIIDPERDIFHPEDNHEAQIYKDLNAINKNEDDDYVSSDSGSISDSIEESEDESDSDSNSEEEAKDNKGARVASSRPRNESPESRKNRKRAVQLEKQEKRKNKIPKHVKKRKAKSTRGNSKKK